MHLSKKSEDCGSGPALIETGLEAMLTSEHNQGRQTVCCLLDTGDEEGEYVLLACIRTKQPFKDTQELLGCLWHLYKKICRSFYRVLTCEP